MLHSAPTRRVGGAFSPSGVCGTMGEGERGQTPVSERV